MQNKKLTYIISVSSLLFFILNANLDRASAQAFDLTGTWSSDDNSTYFMRQIGNEIWWFGMSNEPPIGFSNVFHGTIIDNTIIGNWIDIPPGISNGSGTLKLI